MLIRDVPLGRPTTLVWLERGFECDNCGERHTEDHPDHRPHRRRSGRWRLQPGITKLSVPVLVNPSLAADTVPFEVLPKKPGDAQATITGSVTRRWEAWERMRR